MNHILKTRSGNVKIGIYMISDPWSLTCCRGCILALFQSTTANKIESEHTRDYKKLFPAYEVEILQVTLKIKLKFSHLFRLISNTFSRK